MNVIHFPIKNIENKKCYNESYMRRRLAVKLNEFNVRKNDFLNFIEELENEGKEVLNSPEPICFSDEVFEEYLQEFDFIKHAGYYLQFHKSNVTSKSS